ncbi:MAG: hypothetical protein DCC67_10675 [Planctomycetota bacterium]|nr:MAG: hypothetical protein DCC67_10675 [Planctomycetota bacterium]
MPSKEVAACTPVPVDPNAFNKAASIPYGVTVVHVRKAMEDFIDFLGFINGQLHGRRLERLESFMMPASFSSLVGEFIGTAIPKHCKTVCRNAYHNGHPDIIPAGTYPENRIQYGPEGIEVKASRRTNRVEGHNVEESWLMVFAFESNTSRDVSLGIDPLPFRFTKVIGAKLLKSDWRFSGRSETRRRTITARVLPSGFKKMEANWIYRAQ